MRPEIIMKLIRKGDVIMKQETSILETMSISASAIDTVEDIEYIDGVGIPRGRLTMIFADGSIGKSTALRTSCISAAHNGCWNFVGRRQHKIPMRIAMIFGEESESDIMNGIKMSGRSESFKSATQSGNLKLVSLPDFQARSPRVDEVFDARGHCTDFGSSLFASLEDFKPDVVVIDTLTSVSETGLEDAVEGKNILRFLNSFAAKTDSAVLATGHILKKSGTGHVTDKSTYSDLVDANRGSGQLKNVTRNMINIFKAPPAMFPNFKKRGEHDEMLVAVCKTNLAGSKFPRGVIFPLHRDSENFTITALSDSSELLWVEQNNKDKEEIIALKKILVNIVEAGSNLNFPFAVNPKNPKSLQSFANGTLAPLIGHFKVSNITKALDILERENSIVSCTFSKTGGSAVYDIPIGKFANETAYEEETGQKVPFTKGAGPSLDEFSDEIEKKKRQPQSHPAAVSTPSSLLKKESPAIQPVRIMRDGEAPF